MRIISSANDLILSDFPNLETKFVYKNSAIDENCDFQFFGLQKYFVSVNKKIGIEILQIEEEHSIIERLKKIKVENVYCVSSPNQNSDEVALGLANGEIKFLNYKDFRCDSNYFPSDSSKSSVLYLDYNLSDEYLSSVYENGQINIYGMKTKRRLDTLTFDKTCTLSKFHPLKKFHLAVPTYKGAIYMYDTLSKTDVFHSIDAHKSPCRDVAMSAGHPDLLLTVGFDYVVNVFDTRKRSRSFKLICDCPLSSVAMSECGNYFCVGNLKGELLSYDVRNLGEYLHFKKIHDKPIVRIAFVPDKEVNQKVRKSLGVVNKNNTLNATSATQQENIKTELLLPTNNNSNINLTRRDSFFDFIDGCTGGTQKQTRSSIVNNNLFETDTDFNNFGRRSSGFIGKLSLIKNSNLVTGENIIKESAEDSLVFISEEKPKTPKKIKQPLPQIIINKTPINVSCESSVNTPGDQENSLETEKVIIENNGVINQKENISNLFTKEIEEFPKLPDDKNSTPNNLKRKILNAGDIINNNNSKNNINNNSVMMEQLQNMLSDIKNDIKDLREEMNNKFKKLENEIKFNAETNKMEIINQGSDLFSKQRIVNEQVQEALFYLLKTDEFLNDYSRLKNENKELQVRLMENVMRSKSN